MTGIEPAYSAWEADSMRLLPFVGVRPVLVPRLRIWPLSCGNVATEAHRSPYPYIGVWPVSFG
jgi:hypothetical protein